ncbi:MAG TPA: LPS export ABC transporter periplasmic protein LptC [Steroidobacteraceae bacterium]|nr:LPS export ABC transporter periplasmic protein LptC [Steroidobacteraceae bacterium]
MIPRVLTAAAAIAAFVLGWMLLLDREPSGMGTSTQRPPPQPDPGYSARDAVLIETNASGQPMYTLHASVIHQQPESQEVLLDSVRMQFRDPQGGIWNGRADHARVVDDAARIALMGAVSITGMLPGSPLPAQISTEQLNVDTHGEILSTSAPVMLSWGEQRVNALGLIAQLKDEHLRLESDVHGHYEP